MTDDDMNKPLPPEEMTRLKVIDSFTAGVGQIAKPHKKRVTSSYEQQRLINQAEERRAKKKAKRLKHYEFRQPGG